MLLAILPMIVCSPCHAKIVERYSKTPMAISSGLVEAVSEPTGRFGHSASGTAYEVVRSGDRLELHWNGHRKPLDFYIGSRRMGRSYGYAVDGYLYQAPVGYYANKGLWDMAPGYENDSEPDFHRPITDDCLFCHAGADLTLPKTINRVASLSSLHGISCERCHGDPSAHLQRPQKSNIVNPSKLSFEERDSVCEQCHLSGEARFPEPGRRLTDFRPGERLSKYLAVFVTGGTPTGIRVTSHAEALAASKCRSASGQKLWCGSCHDPHGAAIEYRKVCLGCHEFESCPKIKNMDIRGSTLACIGCHMPRGRAYDGGHTVFTDHSIPRRPVDSPPKRTPPSSLVSYFPPGADPSTSARNLGIAWAQVAEIYGDPRLFERAWPLLRAAASQQRNDPALYAKVGEALEAASKLPEAEKAYRLSLEQGPDQVEVLLRLAALLGRSGNRNEAAALRQRANAILPRQ